MTVYLRPGVPPIVAYTNPNGGVPQKPCWQRGGSRRIWPLSLLQFRLDDIMYV